MMVADGWVTKWHQAINNVTSQALFQYNDFLTAIGIPFMYQYYIIDETNVRLSCF